jgi:hypothetical protein
MMRLSQGQLNLLETCPRKFQHVYLDQLGSLTTPEQQERLTWGNRFHLLMQQRELDLPIALMQDDEPLYQSVQALLNAAPDLFQVDPACIRYSEHRRTLELQGYLLTVIYDLLILGDGQAQILDWKTYPKPQQRKFLEKNWQTRLYLFVLAETTDYTPEQISMTYWFVQAQPEGDCQPVPQPLVFRYSLDQHERNRRDLTHLLLQLSHWQDTGEFPQRDDPTDLCSTCSFAMRCQRRTLTQQANQQLELPPLAEIEEVAL